MATPVKRVTKNPYAGIDVPLIEVETASVGKLAPQSRCFELRWLYPMECAGHNPPCSPLQYLG